MRNILLSSLTIIFTFSLRAFAQEPTFGPIFTTKIKMAELKQTCYSGDANAIKQAAKQKQPIVNQEQAFLFLNKVINSDQRTPIGTDITGAGLNSTVLGEYLTTKHKALIFLLHPIDLSKFEQDDNTARKQDLKDAYDLNVTNKNTYKVAISDLEKLAGKYLTNLKPGAAVTPPGGANPVQLTLDQQGQNAQFYNAVQTQIITLKKRIEEIDSLNKKYISEYNGLFNQYVEDKEVKVFVLHQAKSSPFDNSDYLSEIDDFLIVSLGGQKDLSKLSIEVLKKTDAFTSSINAGTEVISDVTGIRVGKIQGNMPSSLSPPSDPEISINFVRLVKGKLRAPYDLKLKVPDQTVTPSFTVHEINKFLLTFGFSAKYIQPRQFSASGSSVTVIEPDKDLQNTIKGDLFVMLDWCPWGRDLDKLLEDNSKVRRGERFSFSLGIKLSKDPLQSIFLGPAYHLGKDVRIFAGPSLNTIPKEGATLTSATINAGQDYLIKNIDREYKINFMVGLSFSPSTIKTIIGSNKQE